jgi:hypothetical protein
MRHARQRRCATLRSVLTMKKSPILMYLRPLILIALAAATITVRAQMPEMTLTIAGHKITAEVACH